MARNFARIHTSIWSDPEWRDLGPAQHVYLLLLSQPKLSLAGSLDMKPRSWAAMAGLTVGQVMAALDALAEARFIVIDDDTDELVIRTFVTHDTVLNNRNTAKGMWSAWAAIESEGLRDVVLEHLPPEAFKPEFEPLSEPPFEPLSEPPFEPPIPRFEQSSEPPFEPPSPSPSPSLSTPPAPPSRLGTPVDNLEEVAS